MVQATPENLVKGDSSGSQIRGPMSLGVPDNPTEMLNGAY